MAGKKKQTEQSRRFIEAARELECDDDEAAFDEKLKQIGSAPPPKDIKPIKKKQPKPAK